MLCKECVERTKRIAELERELTQLRGLVGECERVFGQQGPGVEAVEKHRPRPITL